MTRLKKHHCVWLLTRPHRSAEWLLDRMKDGFDIHHMDGDHENNDPKNLCLIEHTDHMMIHNGGSYTMGRLNGHKKKKKRKCRKKIAYKNYEQDQRNVVALAKQIRAQNG